MKNNMLRVASGLLAATLISTCAIGGTFAKYVTADDVSDTARVAKFGVVVTTTGTLFDNNYFNQTSGNTPAGAATGSLSVTSSTSDKLIAPGTKNENGMTFSITGTPEVAVKVEIDVDEDALKDVFLGQKNDLPDMTTGNAEDTFDNAADYYPVQYTLTKAGSTLVDGGTLAQVSAALEAEVTATDGVYAPNTDLGQSFGVYTLTWEWPFEAATEAEKKLQDQRDTLLGDLAAVTTLVPNVSLTADTDYSLNAGFGMTITVTQVD